MFLTLKEKRKQHECAEAAAPTSDTSIVQTPGGGLFLRETGNPENQKKREAGNEGIGGIVERKCRIVQVHPGILPCRET